MKTIIPVLGAIVVGTFITSNAMAQSGHVFGDIGGERFDNRSAEIVQTRARRGAVDVEAVVRRETPAGLEGAILYLRFDSTDELNARTLTVADIVVAEDWSPGADEPERFWYAELDDLDVVRIEGAMSSQDAGEFSGQFASERFCLHEWDGDDPVPVLRASEPICKPGTIGFALASDEATAQASRPMDAEILGRIEGRIGEETYTWVTVLPQTAEASATVGRLQPGNTDILRIQAYSPSSPDFRREQVLSITIVGESGVGIRDDVPVPAEVTFFVDRDVHYASQDGSAQAIVGALSFDGDAGEATMSLEGRVCRVEGWTEIEDSCKAFELAVRTQVMRVRE